MTYRAPVDEMLFTIRHVAGFDRAVSDGLYADLTPDLLASVLEEAGKFATDRIAQLNRGADQHGAKLADGKVTTPPGFKDTYKAWAEAGWNSLAGPVEWGGQGLPMLVQAACIEMWNAACMAFALSPVLTAGAIDALAAHASEELQAPLPDEARQRRMDRHHEPDRAAGRLRSHRVAHARRAARATAATASRARRSSSPTASTISPTTSSISCSARLPDAPAGTRGISLFLVPKFLVNADGTLGARNDVALRLASSTSSASTARRPASWSMATRTAPSAISSARRTAASPACSR